MSNYRFCLCYENMILDGWVTEKIFDCFYSGVVPVYLGAPDIAELIPEDTYIDSRKFDDYHALAEYLKDVSDAELLAYRKSARRFLQSSMFESFSPDTFVERFVSIVRHDRRQNCVKKQLQK